MSEDKEKNELIHVQGMKRKENTMERIERSLDDIEFEIARLEDLIDELKEEAELLKIEKEDRYITKRRVTRLNTEAFSFEY